MNTEVFYPEMKQEVSKGFDLIVERLYKKSKVTCLNGIELKENRSIEFQYNKNGNNVYYVSDAGVKKLTKQYNVSYSQLLD